jgi:hypothetical protein
MIVNIDEDILYVSIFEENDLSFKILQSRYNDKIVKILSQIELVDDLYQMIKKYEDNDIIEVIT